MKRASAARKIGKASQLGYSPKPREYRHMDIEKRITAAFKEFSERSTDGTHYFRFCRSESAHHHLACTKRHRVVDLDFCLDESRIAAIGRPQSFSIEDHAITLFGLRQGCRDG